MGVLSAASQWRAAIGFIPGVLGQFALPILSNLHGERDRVRYTQGLRWNLLLTTITAGAAALPVMVGAPLLMRAYGPGFAQGWPVLVLSAATAVISCVNGVVGTAILSRGSVWAGFAFNAMWAGVFIFGCYRLVASHRALGLVMAMLGAYLAHTVWQAVYLRYRLSRSRAA
jgi:O-antigen/teichoic acid export membrane protein